MRFKSGCILTNAVALALTIQLRRRWPGAKPIGIVTSTKSHGGKDTIVAFATGNTPKVSVDYEEKDWAFRQGFVAALQVSPDVGLVNIENVRLSRRGQQIASATLEQYELNQ